MDECLKCPRCLTRWPIAHTYARCPREACETVYTRGEEPLDDDAAERLVEQLRDQPIGPLDVRVFQEDLDRWDGSL